ncbi:MAG: glycosyltransferase, partial [Roseibium sp.]|uniref:glycosyltransferase n=1 Tax=Roseibium sp. TaxID=1936156 RepID=UPI00263643A0
MRILMPCAAFPPFIDGGGPISALQIAHMLKKEGHDIRILHVSDEEKIEEFEGIPVKRMPSLNIYWNYYEPRSKLQKITWHLLENGNPRAFFAMRKEMQEFQPDVVHTVSIENINVATWAAAKSLGIPVAHTIHSAFLMTWKGVMQKAGKPLDRQTFPDRMTSIGKRFFSRFVDLVIGESNDVVQRHLKEGYFKNAISRCIPGAIPDEIADHPRLYPADR